MGMREPAFWWQPGGGRLLAPLGALYGAVASARMAAPGASAGVPVICLGNLTVGGAGKTPAALAVAHLLLAAHARPFFLSRGYGGRLAGPVRVDLSFHHAADVGDEPLLLARPRTHHRRARPRRRRQHRADRWRRRHRHGRRLSKSRRSKRTSRSSWSTARAASATAGSFRPARLRAPLEVQLARSARHRRRWSGRQRGERHGCGPPPRHRHFPRAGSSPIAAAWPR